MAPQKLSDSDKQTILALYRYPEETTSTLASRYGVSNTTISRILKQGLSEQEYETLVQQKRGGLSTRFQLFASEPSTPPEAESERSEPSFSEPSFELASLEPEPEPESEPEPLPQLAGTKPKPQLREIPPPQPRKRERAAIANSEATTFEAPSTEAAEVDGFEAKIAEVADKNLSSATQIPLLEFSAAMEEQISTPQLPLSYPEVTPRVAETLAEDLLTEEEDFDDLEEGDLEELDDDDLDDDDDDDDSFDTGGDLQDFAAVHIQSKEWVNVLPLSEAPIPKIFYLVVDRASELITRPLRDFADLGQIPNEETQEKTLPIFDNHRVARRFSRRMQRVVKVPDGRMLHKVGPYLQAKGITRLLIDGQVYSI
ncbi:MAG: transposase [Leptolyngbyaceae cyanobacterium RM2_2_4]|nr:transposase [Leptolyngbyaceae cyanobacterium SM1_4_3]NJO49994.1 transposase [Leptolyngbyaceae cyanobacterium RM2_2_4]NJO75700.1 transposase [Leptolyngbyaceae cyanobacterium RM1_406_9]